MKRTEKIGLFIALVLIICCLLSLWMNESIFYKPEREEVHHIEIKSIPENISFAGEKVHFKTPTSYQLYYRELLINRLRPRAARLLKSRAKKMLPVISVILKKYQIPEDFKYIAIAESYLNNEVESQRGAAGIWQLTQPTALSLGLKINEEIDERLDIIKSTHAACKLIIRAKKKFGNWTSAAAAYNRGLGGLERALTKQGANSYYDLSLNFETARYLYKVLAIKDQMEKINL